MVQDGSGHQKALEVVPAFSRQDAALRGRQERKRRARTGRGGEAQVGLMLCRDEDLAALPPQIAALLTNCRSHCYWGEYILSFAACNRRTRMVGQLLDAGVDVNAVDIFGNSVLHILVIADDKWV